MIFEGSERTGGVTSADTTTRNAPKAALNAVSDALHCTTVVPIGNVAPEGASQNTCVVPSMRSLAVAAKVTTAPAALVAPALIVPGSDITGGVVSTTVIVEAIA